MVSLSATGEIFSLSAPFEAQTQDGWLSLDGEAVIGMDATAELSLCHGINAAIGAEIAAALDANLGTLFLVGAGIDLEASAQAAAFARLRVSGNIFDDFGVTLGVGAAASARASAELAAFFDTTALAEMGGALFGRDSTAFAMFLAFLNELRLGVGVRGRASAGAAAWAVADLSGNLLEDPARFDISVDADAAAGVGAGGKAFFRCEIDDPRRMAMTISELATSDLAGEARRLLPDEQHFLVDWFELIAPAATGVVWELAQSTALGTLGPPEEMAERFTRAVLGRLQTLLLDKAVEVGFDLANQALGDLGYQLRLRDDPAVRAQVADGIRALAEALPQRNLSLPDLGELAGDLLDVLDTAGEATTARQVRRPLAVMWTAAACAVALRDPNAGGATASFQTQARVIGAGAVAGPAAASLPLPPPPDWVRAEWAIALERSAQEPFSFADGVDALIAFGIGSLLREPEPLQPLLRDLGLALDLSVGELVETLIGLTQNLPLAGTPLYRALRDLLIRQVDDLLIARLVPALRAGLPPGEEAAVWLEEGVVPSLLGVRHFVVARVDAFVGGGATGDLTPMLNEFRTALGVLAGKVVLRNVAVLHRVIVELVHREVPPVLRSVARAIEAGRLDDPATFGVVTAWRGPAASLLAPPVSGPVEVVLSALGIDLTVFEESYTRLLVGLLDIAADSYAIPSARDRARLHDLTLRCLLVDDLATDYSAVDSFADLVGGLNDCNFVPHERDVLEYSILAVQVLAARTQFVTRRVAPLLGRFIEDVGAPGLAAMDEAFRDTLELLDRALTAAAAQVRLLDRIVQDAIDDLNQAIDDLDRELRELREALRDPGTRAAMIDALHEAGRAEAVSQGEDLGGEAAGVAAGVAFDVAWTVSSFLLDPVLDVLGLAAGAGSQVLGGARTGAEAVAELSAWVSDQVAEALESISLGELASQLTDDLVEDVMATVTDLPVVRAAVLAAGAANGRRDAAQRRRDTATADRDAARARRSTAEANRSAVTRNRIRPRIVAPAPLVTSRSGRRHTAVATAGQPILRVLLAGGDHRLLAPGAGRRLVVRLNARVLEITGQHLSVGSPEGCVLERPLSVADGLRPGVNVVECAVLSSTSAAVDRVVFAALPGTKVPASDVRIDLAASLLDVDGDDHLAPEKEQVTLVNAGSTAVDLEGWSVLDRAGHTYLFGPTRIAAGRRVRLHTGVGSDTATTRYWGRRRAVWNNTGDTISLVGPDGLVVETVVTRPKAGSR